MNSQEIRTVTFEQTRKGYRPEDVDDFLSKVANTIDQIAAERDAAIAEKDLAVAAKEDMESKMYILAEKAEEYRGQEDILKTALINAQRMGETVVHEAKQKADQMLRDATGQAELLRQRAETEINRERRTLENLVVEVSRFKANILNLYKQHIESLSALDPPVEHAQEVLDENAPAIEESVEREEEEMVVEYEQDEPLIIPHTVPQEEREEAHEEAAADEAAPPAGNAVHLFEGQLLDEQ